MKQVEVSANANWEAIFQSLAEGDVILTRQGHPVALLSDFDEDDLEWYARERDPAFLQSIASARKQVKQGQTVRHDDLKARLGLQSGE